MTIQRFRQLLPFVRSVLLAGLFACIAHAAPIIAYQVTDLGLQNGVATFRYTYSISGFDFFQDEELDIRFDPVNYGVLSNGQAGADFDLLLFQPNSPVGSDGDYSALALVDHASLAGTFSVDFEYLGPGTPGPQHYFVYDNSGPVSILIDSGATAPLVAAVPEPSSLFLSGLGILSLMACFPLHRLKHQK